MHNMHVLCRNKNNTRLMSRFNSIEMAKTVSSHAHISTQKTFFGLLTKAYYIPTGSTIRSYENYFRPELHDDLTALFTLKEEQMSHFISRLKGVKSVPNGNLRLDLCVSDDRQFVAIQLYQFQNFLYRPISEIRYFEGPLAEQVQDLFE